MDREPVVTDPIAFDGRVAIVTGGGGGLGRSYCVELARRGAKVVVNDLGGAADGSGSSTGAADQVVADIIAAGGEAIASYDSVATAEGGQAITDAALDTFGTVDIVINNAGNLRDKAFANVAFDDLRALIDVHLLGAFHVTQPAFRVMKERGYGRILNTSSGAGIWGNFGQASYGAAKTALIGLTNVLAVEGARYGITANAIAPIAKSRLTVDFLGPEAEGLEPDLVMPLSLFLVSDDCDLTHELFSVGGGRFARVFIGLTTGWTAERGTVPSPEDVREHLAEIRAEDGYIVPTSIHDEMVLVAKLLERAS